MRRPGLHGVVVAGQGFAEILDLGFVDVGQVGDHLNHGAGTIRRFYGSPKIFLIGFELFEPIGGGGRVIFEMAGADHVEQTLDRAFGFGQGAVGGAPGFAGALLPRLKGGMDTGDEPLLAFGLAERMLEAAEDARLEQVAGDDPIVGAGAGAAAPMVRAAVFAGANNNPATAAGAAGHQAGERVPGPAPMLARRGAETILDRMRLFPELLIDDAQIRDVLDRPGRFRLGQVGFFAGDRMIAFRCPAINDLAAVNMIVQDTSAALAVAGDGVGPPLAAAWGGDALTIELAGDRAGAFAGGIGAEDAADDRRFVFVDGAAAADDLAPIV